MINKTFSFALGIAILLSSCHKDSVSIDKDPIDYVAPVWNLNLHMGTPSSNSFISENLVFGDIAIIATTDGVDNRFISGVNLRSGDLIWNWNDIYQAPTEYFDITYTYAHDNLMTYQVGSRSYCINLENGSTKWKIRRENSFDSEVVGLGDVFYILGKPQDTLQQFNVQVGYRGDIESGQIEEFLIPELSQEYVGPGGLLGGISNLLPFVKGADTLFIVTFSEPLPNWNIRPMVGLYNATQKKWIYDRVVIFDPSQISGINHPPVIADENIIIQVGNGIVCMALYSGDILWTNKSFPLDFLFSGFIVEDGVIYANCEDDYLYALNLQSGQILWKEKTAGTSSRLRYLNGVVYLSGGSTGRIHAIDTETGKTVWRLDPEKYHDGSDDFKPDIYAIPGQDGEKGKLIIETYMTAYCVEAYR